MDNKAKYEEILADLLNGFDEARKQNPDIGVDQYLAEKLSQYGSDDLKNKVKESSAFIDELDKNTASVQNAVRVDSWIEDNVYNSMSEQDRQEFEKGVDEAAKIIKEQSVKQFGEDK